MFATIKPRIFLTATGLLLTTGLVVQLPSGEWRDQLRDYVSPGRTEVRRPTEPLVSSSVAAEGRIVAHDGAEVVVGTEIAGLILRLSVKEKSVVRAGDVIAELSSADLRASREESLARIAEAEADIRFHEREDHRERALLARSATTPRNVDANVHGLESAKARRAAAAACRDRFDALIAKTRITAPIDGVVTARHVQLGEIVEPGRPLVTVVDLNRLRIEAEVDEFDAASVALGSPVAITVEGYGSKSWRGKVEEIPDSVVSRRSRPADPGRPIDARVLPLKIAFDEPTPFKLGQRVDVEIASPILHAR
jgi:HlyD family secretion protein